MYPEYVLAYGTKVTWVSASGVYSTCFSGCHRNPKGESCRKPNKATITQLALRPVRPGSVESRVQQLSPSIPEFTIYRLHIVLLTQSIFIISISKPHCHPGCHCRHYNPILLRIKIVSYFYQIQNGRVTKFVDDRKSHLRIRAAGGGDEKQQFLNSITSRKRDYSTSKDLFIALAGPTLSPMTTRMKGAHGIIRKAKSC